MYPADRKYTESHEWVRLAEDECTVGVSDFAQRQLGDVVFVEMPAVGRQLAKGEAFGTVESVKAVSELYSPVSGSVLAVNQDLQQRPERINQAPYEAWIIKLKTTQPLDESGLLSAAHYELLVK